MSYTLRGRLESRLAALLPVIVAACMLGAALHRWWPIELAALMAVVGVALDIQLYDRLLAYQPGWATSAARAARARAADGNRAPVGPRRCRCGRRWRCSAPAWLVAQALGHAGFPLLRVSYAEDGGELGRMGALAALAVAGTIVAAGVIAWAARPPTVHLVGRRAPGPARDHAPPDPRRPARRSRARRHRRPRERRHDPQRHRRRRRERDRRGRCPRCAARARDACPGRSSTGSMSVAPR